MDWRHMREMLAAGDANYSELKNVCIWNKNNAGMGTFYRSKHEMVFVWKYGSGPHLNTFELGQNGRHRTNVWDYEGVNTMRAGRLDELAMHPTVKPVAMVADAIKDCSKRGSLVLDPFCGSGTILIAAEKTGRRARAIELDPKSMWRSGGGNSTRARLRAWHPWTRLLMKCPKPGSGKLPPRLFGRRSTHARLCWRVWTGSLDVRRAHKYRRAF